MLITNLPFSTPVRHGGTHAARDGRANRTVFGCDANAPLLAFLDDDNNYLPEHTATLTSIIKDPFWSSGQRILVDEETNERLAFAAEHSVSSGKGHWVHLSFIDTNCIMVDKLRVGADVGLWVAGSGLHANKTFFKAVSKGSYRMQIRRTVPHRVYKLNYNCKFIQLTRSSQI